MLANDSVSNMAKELEAAIRACKSSVICSFHYEALGCRSLSEQWQQEAAKLIHHIYRKFPLEAVFRACDEIEVSELGA